MNLYELERSAPVGLTDPSGEKCTVRFKCYYLSETLSGCTRNCEYQCIETSRCDSYGGRVGCKDVPHNLVRTDSQQMISLCCILTGGKYGTPGNCPNSYDQSFIYGDWGILDDMKNCDRSDCIDRCALMGEILRLGCEALEGTKKHGCEIWVQGIEAACKQSCGICENP